VTPLRDGGEALDDAAIGPLCDFLAVGGLDGVLALGTTGEGMLLAASERRRAAELFLAASRGRLDVAVHCGAQTTRETCGLAAHAAEIGAAAVAVIAPPYYPLDDAELLAHLREAARACAPLPFYLYEFEARSGYAVPLSVIESLREVAANLAGLKVSDRPFERFRPYLIEGLDVFVGPEPLIAEGLRAGAIGAVSGLASAFPERVAAVVREPTDEGAAELGRLRAAIERFPFQSALKQVLGARGVPIEESVRAPLRPLTAAERAELDQWLESS